MEQSLTENLVCDHLNEITLYFFIYCGTGVDHATLYMLGKCSALETVELPSHLLIIFLEIASHYINYIVGLELLILLHQLLE